MTIFEQLRTEIDELYELTSHNPEIYQKILELAQKANFLGKEETLASWKASINN